MSKPKKPSKFLKIAGKNVNIFSRRLTVKQQARVRIAIAKDVLASIKAKRFKVASSTGYVVVGERDEDSTDRVRITTPVQTKYLEAFSNIIYDAGEMARVRKVNTSDNPYVAPPVKACTACALGTAFICSVDRFNTLKLNDLAGQDPSNLDRSVMEKHLGRWFSPVQMDLIEEAFETRYDKDPYLHYSDDEDTKRAVRFGARYKTDTGRLTAIMNNIIKNKGTFIP